jgi:hypothetical protein
MASSSDATLAIASRERQKGLMPRAWILSGLFFMALPGTLLGFSNLMAISTNHGLGGLPAAWMEGHGHAQMFGWIGSFFLGIGFYSQPARARSAIRIPLTAFVFWTSGVALRWFANIYAWQWRALLHSPPGWNCSRCSCSFRQRLSTNCLQQTQEKARGRGWNSGCSRAD